MGPILLLTKNILAEEEFQKKLQRLNYEVFSSSSLLTKKGMQSEFLHFFNLFYCTIISETVSDIELQWLLPILNKSSTIVIRKNDHSLEAEGQDIRVNFWLSNESSIEELRETLMRSSNHEYGRQEADRFSGGLHTMDFDQRDRRSTRSFFSTMEGRLLDELYEAKGEVVSREELCVKIWGGEITDSKMAMLSTAVRKLRNKLRKKGYPDETILTTWGKGYRLSQRFYEIFDQEQNMTNERTQNQAL